MNADVMRELEEFTQKYGPEEGLLKYLNNFRFHLPGGWFRDLALPFWNTPYCQIGSTGHFSPKKNQQTPAQFYDRIDLALASEGIIIPLRLRPLTQARDPLFKKIRKLHELVLPGYGHLRDEGYIRSDLV